MFLSKLPCPEFGRDDGGDIGDKIGMPKVCGDQNCRFHTRSETFTAACGIFYTIMDNNALHLF